MMAKVTYLEERMRCLKLVRAYRERVEEITIKGRSLGKPALRDMFKVADAVASSLRMIEREIESPRAANKRGGEFSLEEMEIAEKLISEQEHNPFEV